jgi:hypothetical protein
MISPSFYNKENLVRQFLNGKVPHYPVKDPSVTMEWYEYTVKYGENLYTIAERIFGKNLEYMWTYIADNNPPRLPDDWQLGDIVRLPKIIIRDSDTYKPIYSNVPSSTTSI